jgi:hypothetical protein
MNLSSYASTWKTALEEDEAREESASSFPSIAPIGSSLQQHASMGWKQQQQQQYLHQQNHQQQQTHSASADDRWGAGVDSPSMKHHFQQSNNRSQISNDTTSGWSDQRDTSQHSRGSIWTDDHSRSSHTSAGTGTTSLMGTYSSRGTHPFTATDEPSATSKISYRHDDPLLGNLARLSLGGGNEPSQQSYYNAMSVGPPTKQQQQPHPQPHAPAPHNPFYNSVASTQQNHICSSSSVMSVESSIPGLMGAGSGSTGGTAISQYSWNPEQQQQQARKPPQVQSSLAAAAAAPATTTNLMPPPGFRQPCAEAGGGGSDSHSLGSRSYRSASDNADNESVTSNSERSRGKREGRGGGGGGRGSSYREKQPQQRQQHNHQGRGRGSGRGSSNSSSMPPPPLREYNSSGAAAAGNIKAHAHATKGNDRSMYNSERSFASSSSSLNRAAGTWSGAASATADAEAMGSSEAIRQLMKPAAASSYLNHTGGSGAGCGSSSTSSLQPSVLEMNGSYLHTAGAATSRTADSHPILPQALQMNDDSFGHTMPSDDEEDDDEEDDGRNPYTQGAGGSPKSKEKKWLLRMNRRLAEIPVGDLDPATMPLSAVMNTWAKTKSSQGASMVEMWLKRAQQEYDAGNHRVEPTAKMYTMAGTWLL